MDLLNRDLKMAGDVAGLMINQIEPNVRSLSANKAAGKAVVAMESMGQEGKRVIIEVTDSIGVALESMRNALESALGSKVEFSTAQVHAATQAGVMATDFEGCRKRTLREGYAMGADASTTVTMESFRVSDMLSERSYAAEAYNEQDNRSAVPYSIVYNLQSSRQDAFGEAMYPTITIPGDQAGVSITNNLLFVLDNVDRDVSGSTYNLNRKNLLRAVADATVLKKNQTQAVPVYRTQSAAVFVSTSVIPTRDVLVDPSSLNPVPTGPLIFAKAIDLLSVSQPDWMVATGTQNQTDTLDPQVLVQNLYITVGESILCFPVGTLPGFNFVPNAQGDYKNLTMTADTTSVLLNNATTDYLGNALTGALAALATDNIIIRCHVAANGNVRTDTGNITVYQGIFEVYQATNATTSAQIALTDSSVSAIVTALNGATWTGWDPLAYRSNANRRQQGQFIDVNKQFQRYIVPLRSPISTRHPAHTDGQIDASDVQALITATRIRLANEAVTTVLASAEALSTYVDARDLTGEGPDVLGVGRYYVRAQYIERPFDALQLVDGLSSAARPADIQAALMNQIRDMAYLLYRDSEYKAAADAMYGGLGPVPKVILATDPYTAQYLMQVGDLRSIGPQFGWEVVSTLDTRFRGKVVITFGIFEGDRNSTINPLNNGNMLWAPELVLTANISRQGSFNKETMVQPRYLFIQNLPIMGVLDVSNIADALGKIPLNMADVTPTEQ